MILHLPNGTEVSSEEVGVYVIAIFRGRILFIEKPGSGRGRELPGGHGKPEDELLEEIGEREVFEETHVKIEIEKMHLVDLLRLQEHTIAIFLVEVDSVPKNILETIGDEGETVHLDEIKKLDRENIFAPHREFIRQGLRRWRRR